LKKKRKIPKDLFSRVRTIFGNKREANNWFHEPKPKLGGKTPYEVLVTERGRGRVERILDDISKDNK